MKLIFIISTRSFIRHIKLRNKTKTQCQFVFTELLWPQALLLVIAYLSCFPTEFISNIIMGAHSMPEPVSLIHAQYLGFPWPIILIFPISAFLFLEIQPRIQFFMMHILMRIFLLLLFVLFSINLFCLRPIGIRWLPTTCQNFLATHLFWHHNYCLASLCHVPHIYRFFEFGTL